MAIMDMSASAPASDDSSDDSSYETPGSPDLYRAGRIYSGRSSEVDIHGRLKNRAPADETTSLLDRPGTSRKYNTTPKGTLSRQGSGSGNIIKNRTLSRNASFTRNVAEESAHTSTLESLTSLIPDRVWYDQFTSTDWVQDMIADGSRLRELRKRKDWVGRFYAFFDKAEGWILVGIIGVLTAFMAYYVDVTESVMFDLKEGYCSNDWKKSRRHCCERNEMVTCQDWVTWSEILGTSSDSMWLDYAIYVALMFVLAMLACLLTLTTKTIVPSAVQIATLDEDLGASRQHTSAEARKLKAGGGSGQTLAQPATHYYPAAGSGVAEVKVILSGFVLHGYLGMHTLVVKTLALVLAVSSGLCLGKEGPYVHIATCIGNIACRLFSKYNHNDGKRREVLSASAASGVAVAFGAPIGGTLFSLEEVSYYFPPKTLFRTFFCCIVAALTLKFLNPYGTGKIVLFEVRYINDWRVAELFVFVLLGMVGGLTGAMFIKASRFWAQTFRQIPTVKKWPLMEVAAVALLTGIVSFWNRYTRLGVTELMLELASPCDEDEIASSGLCPSAERLPEVIKYLAIAFVVKFTLTIFTFGVKLPAGIYVPSMVIGGILGRSVGHMVELLVHKYPAFPLFAGCLRESGTTCIEPGVYAMVAAGATMCGITRLSVTLAVILFELTGSLDHVLPFCLGVLVSKWTADAVEPLSIYDLLTDMNSYPYLDNKIRPIFNSELAEITRRAPRGRVIDVTASNHVSARRLRRKLERLHAIGDLDGGLPIIRKGILVGLICAPDLEFALDRLSDEASAKCLMVHPIYNDFGELEESHEDLTDFTHFIDQAPVSLDLKAPMDLVYECFAKLGLRYICVLQDGRFAGMVHKKQFLKYMKELEPEHV